MIIILLNIRHQIAEVFIPSGIVTKDFGISKTLRVIVTIIVLILLNHERTSKALVTWLKQVNHLVAYRELAVSVLCIIVGIIIVV